MVRVLLINCFQAGVFERSAVRQRVIYGWSHKRVRWVNLPGILPGTFLASCSRLKNLKHHVKFLHAPVTHLPFAGSIPQRGSSAPVEVPIDPVVFDGAGAHDQREAFHLCPCGTDCGICSRFVNHDLRFKKIRKGSRSGGVWHKREVFLDV